METTSLLKSAFGRKFRYGFFITYFAFLFTVILAILYNYLEYDIRGPFFWAFTRSILLTIAPDALCWAVAVGAFIGFQGLPATTGKSGFLKVLAVGLSCSVLLALGIYGYSQYIMPGQKAQAASLLYKVKDGPRPIELGEKPYEENFRNLTASMTDKAVLRERTDSIGRIFDAQREAASELLATFPDTLAEGVYAAYKLEAFGVDFRSADKDSLTLDKDYDAAISELLSDTYELRETYYELKKLLLESVRRKIPAVLFPIYFVLFATIGFSLRRKTMRAVFNVLAVLVVVSYTMHFVSQQTEAYLSEPKAAVREYRDIQRRR